MKACVMLETTKVSLSSEGQFNQTKAARTVSRAISQYTGLGTQTHTSKLSKE